MISEKSYEQSAQAIKCEVAAIKAVSEVESDGCGFLPDNKCKILFEPHVFWALLKKKGLHPESIIKSTPKYAIILYPNQGQLPYGHNSEQWDKMALAQEIDTHVALMAASYGRFQIMGENYEECCFPDIDKFVESMCKIDPALPFDQQDESEHLTSFVNFLFSKKLHFYLQQKDWKAFARSYNGPDYRRSPSTIMDDYDYKLAHAYLKFKTP